MRALNAMSEYMSDGSDHATSECHARAGQGANSAFNVQFAPSSEYQTSFRAFWPSKSGWRSGQPASPPVRNSAS